MLKKEEPIKENKFKFECSTNLNFESKVLLKTSIKIVMKEQASQDLNRRVYKCNIHTGWPKKNNPFEKLQ